MAWRTAWLGGALVGIGNGVARQAAYERRVDEQTGHQLSTAIAIGALAGCFWLLEDRWPIPDLEEALKIGGTWFALTIGFEFCFSRLIAKRSWQDLLTDYNMAGARTWPLGVEWMSLGPPCCAACIVSSPR